MKVVDLSCGCCGISFKKEKKEHTRRIKMGVVVFYCSLSCAAIKSNDDRKIPDVVEYRKCLYCDKNMKVTRRPTDVGRLHCSLSCASLNSVTDKRREAATVSGHLNKHNLTLQTFALALKTREAWKYEKLKIALDNKNIAHEFECGLEKYVFDLALTSRRIYIEFDGKDHDNEKQIERDQIKSELARKAGWTVIRIRVKENTVIPARLLKQALLVNKRSQTVIA